MSKRLRASKLVVEVLKRLMARKPSRMVLYEAASKAKEKPRTSFVKRKPVRTPLSDRTVKAMPAMSIKRRNGRKSKFYMAIAAIVLLVVLGMFALSRLSDNNQSTVAGQINTDISDQPEVDTDNRTGTDSDNEIENSGSPGETVLQPSLEKTQEIVVASFAFSNELVPVKKFFAENGVETNIIRSGSGYVLVTVEKYITPAKPIGKAQIDAAKNKIKDIGENYRPPTGYGSFTFGDIYARKFR